MYHLSQAMSLYFPSPLLQSYLPPCLIHPISLHNCSTVISSPSVNNTLESYGVHWCHPFKVPAPGAGRAITASLHKAKVDLARIQLYAMCCLIVCVCVCMCARCTYACVCALHLPYHASVPSLSPLLPPSPSMFHSPYFSLCTTPFLPNLVHSNQLSICQQHMSHLLDSTPPKNGCTTWPTRRMWPPLVSCSS